MRQVWRQLGSQPWQCCKQRTAIAIQPRPRERRVILTFLATMLISPASLQRGHSHAEGSMTPLKNYFSGLSRNTFLLMFASLFADVSTEMLYPVLPVFLT